MTEAFQTLAQLVSSGKLMGPPVSDDAPDLARCPLVLRRIDSPVQRGVLIRKLPSLLLELTELG